MLVRGMLLFLVACGEKNESQAAKPAEAQATTTPASTPPAPPAPRPAGVPEVVAQVGGKPVTWDEVYQNSSSELIEAEIALNEARRNAIDGMIMQRLVESEASKQGITADQLVQAEMSKLPLPSDAEVEKFYNENKAQMPGPLDQVRAQIVAYLQQQQGSTAIQSLLGRLKAENDVKILLEPYRVQVDPKSGPRKGAASAPVQIIEFSDFQCPYCGVAAETVGKVVAKYGDQVSVVYRHFPLPMHAQAERAAQASMCANDQGGFWKFHDALFAERKAWTDDDFKSYAKKAGLDQKKLVDCLDKGTHVATVQADMEDGKMVGMNGTPGFYINGIVLTGARPLEDFVEVIDAELARLGAK